MAGNWYPTEKMHCLETNISLIQNKIVYNLNIVNLKTILRLLESVLELRK